MKKILMLNNTVFEYEVDYIIIQQIFFVNINDMGAFNNYGFRLQVVKKPEKNYKIPDISLRKSFNSKKKTIQT